MRVPLLGGTYQAESVIANAQRCINLYPEINPPQTTPPVPITHYPTPGLNLLVQGPSQTVRFNYRASNGDFYSVIGSTVFFISHTFDLLQVGSIGGEITPVSMTDNGLAILIADGTSNLYAINMVTKQFGLVTGGNTYGATRVDIIDTFFILNRPGTAQWYISLSSVTYDNLINGDAFNSLDIVSKSGYPDPVQSLIVVHREIWIFGQVTTEIWYDSGAPDFPFQIFPGAFIQHGCVAKYSVAAQDLSTYWLSQDQQGHIIVLRGSNYQALRISTHAIEQEFAKYDYVEDAIGFCYQENGHTFYVITFPSADATWAFDMATELWHQRAWTDNNGILHRIRTNTCANVYGKIVAGDWQNGALYEWSTEAYTDNGNPISRVRGFPHLLQDDKRVIYTKFVADIEVGTDDGSVDSSTPDNPPMVSLRFSDNRGVSFGEALEQSLGAAGEYLTNPQWPRLGLARDRVFEISWSVPTKTALQGAWIEFQTALT